MERIFLVITLFFLASCATIVNDAMVPVTLSFSDGSEGECVLRNKRGTWQVDIPSTPYVRRSDDALSLDCETSDGRRAVGSIESTMGAEIVASAVFFDLGITDAITDKHRNYASSYVVAVKPKESL